MPVDPFTKAFERMRNTRTEQVRSKEDMHWQPKNGAKMLVSQMETRHLFYSLRMIYNRTVPPEFRIDADADIMRKVSVDGDENRAALQIMFFQIGKQRIKRSNSFCINQRRIG